MVKMMKDPFPERHSRSGDFDSLPSMGTDKAEKPIRPPKTRRGLNQPRAPKEGLSKQICFQIPREDWLLIRDAATAQHVAITELLKPAVAAVVESLKSRKSA